MVMRKLGDSPRFAAVFHVPVINQFVAVPSLTEEALLLIC